MLIVDFELVNSKMLCVYQDFSVWLIDIASDDIIKIFNLQEIEGFEISEEIEQDEAVALAID